jgi:hypothetical protein
MLTPIGTFPTNIDHRRALEARLLRAVRLYERCQTIVPNTRQVRLKYLINMTDWRLKHRLADYAHCRGTYLRVFRPDLWAARFN